MIKINLNEKENFYSCDNCFLYIQSAWPQEPTLCQFLGNITYIGAYLAFQIKEKYFQVEKCDAKRISLTWFFATLTI